MNYTEHQRAQRQERLVKIVILYDHHKEASSSNIKGEGLKILSIAKKNRAGYHLAKIKENLPAAKAQIEQLNPIITIVVSPITYNLLLDRDANSPVTEADILPGSKKFISSQTSGGRGSLEECLHRVQLFVQGEAD